MQTLEQIKTMLQELATDEMSRETLIWTCQYKLDAHMERIAAILAVLTAHISTPTMQTLEQIKTMLQELATDELSRETLIWTCQYKLDAHMERIAAILAVLTLSLPG
jgi:thymidylate synthase